MACADDVWYALIQWEDRFMSVIGIDKIVHPPKGSSVPGYVEGQLVRAKYERTVYEAVICELHVNKKYLGEQAKLPPAYTFIDAKRKSLVASQSSDTGPGVNCSKNSSDTICTSKNLQSKQTPDAEQASKHSLDSGSESEDTLSKQSPGAESEQKNQNDMYSGSTNLKQIPTAAKDSQDLKSPKDRYGWEEESKSLRRKIRRLEERISTLEKTNESCCVDEDEQLMQSVGHLSASDVQEVMLSLAKAVFTVDELISCSRTGKKTSKCVGEPRPPFDIAKLEKLERVVRKKTQISKEMFVNKLENIQKVLRRRAKST